MKQLRVGLALVAVLAAAGSAGAQPLTVYDDALAAGWEDWSWAEHDLANPSPVASGTASIRFEPDEWEGLFFHATAAHSVADYDRVRFQVHGGAAGGQALTVSIQLGGTGIGQAALGPFLPGGAVPAGAWAEAVVPLSALGADPTTLFDGVILQAGSGGDQPAVFVDEVELLPNTTPPPPPGPVVISIDPALERRPIDPRIYGVNFGDDALHAGLRFPVRRRGGNATTRYNWLIDVHNTASDYFFQNIPAPDPGTLPHGSAADVFHDRTFEHGGVPVETVPQIGWTPRSDGRIKRWGFSVADYGAQDQVECDLYDPPPPWCSNDSGNGRCASVPSPSGFCQDGLIVGNDPGDTSEPIGPGFVTDWMAHVASRVGTAGQGGVSLWALDNEPMLWFETHRDVSPEPLDYDGLWARTVQYAGAIKAADPQAETLGPVVWGWCAYFTSAADWQVSPTCLDGPDRQAHGGLPLVAWYLEQVCAHQQSTGVRLVDYLDVHYYPQGGVAGLGPSDSGEDAVTSARRLRSLRELWDPTWVAESWIGEPVALIPRMRGWIDDHCPGTQLAITEYRWGADDGPSSALAHAEALAIFGREGVDLATRWVAPEPATRVVDSFRLFLDYDGAGSRVVGDSVRAQSGDVEDVGAYAVERPGRLLVLLFNRDVVARQAQVTVTGGAGEGGTLYRFDPVDPLAEIGPVAVAGDGFTLDLPARSASLVELATALFADGFETGDTTAWSLTAP